MNKLARQAFYGMHPALWYAMKSSGCPTWRTEGVSATIADAEAWILLLPENKALTLAGCDKQ